MEPLERLQGPLAPSWQTCQLSTWIQSPTVGPTLLVKSFRLWSSGFHRVLQNTKAHIIQFHEPVSTEAATEEVQRPDGDAGDQHHSADTTD